MKVFKYFTKGIGPSRQIKIEERYMLIRSGKFVDLLRLLNRFNADPPLDSKFWQYCHYSLGVCIANVPETRDANGNTMYFQHRGDIDFIQLSDEEAHKYEEGESEEDS